MTRTPLPNRRPNLTIGTSWNGHPISVSVGISHEGHPKEVFADTAKGGDMRAVLADACVVISIALQHGISASDLAKSLGRVPNLAAEGDAPASPIGTILEAIKGASV